LLPTAFGSQASRGLGRAGERLAVFADRLSPADIVEGWIY